MSGATSIAPFNSFWDATKALEGGAHEEEEGLSIPFGMLPRENPALPLGEK